jgi:hypothetical protein
VRGTLRLTPYASRLTGRCSNNALHNLDSKQRETKVLNGLAVLAVLAKQILSILSRHDRIRIHGSVENEINF